jgi:predicted acetyltransferase
VDARVPDLAVADAGGVRLMGGPAAGGPAIRAATAQDWDGICRLQMTAFHVGYDPLAMESQRRVFRPEQTLLVDDGDQVVAGAAALTRQLTVPGGVVPATHLTAVAVAATHRRQGLLTHLMRRHLRDSRDALALLWPSEGRIYHRFGFGPASQRLQFDIDIREVRWVHDQPGEGRLRGGPPAELLPQLCAVYERLRPERPGWSSRDADRWAVVLADTPVHRLGGTELQATVYESASGVDGYALWRTRSGWTPTSTPRGEAWVVEVAAATPAAYRALWRFLLGLDLTRAAKYQLGAVDEPLLHLVDEPRELGTRVLDGQWARVVDVGAALAARRYATELDVVIQVADPVIEGNAGRWRLAGGRSGSSCARTTANPDLVCGIADLSAAYLGGTSLAALAAAGRVTECCPGAVATASAAFGWHRAPAALEIF